MQAKMQERRAAFQEALENDLDRVTKELLDSTLRLDWVEDEVSAGSLDQWIDTVSAALTKLRMARMRKIRTVRT